MEENRALRCPRIFGTDDGDDEDNEEEEEQEEQRHRDLEEEIRWMKKSRSGLL